MFRTRTSQGDHFRVAIGYKSDETPYLRAFCTDYMYMTTQGTSCLVKSSSVIFREIQCLHERDTQQTRVRDVSALSLFRHTVTPGIESKVRGVENKKKQISSFSKQSDRSIEGQTLYTIPETTAVGGDRGEVSIRARLLGKPSRRSVEK
jgi:hypothetical protein